MDIQLGNQRLLVLSERLSFEDIRQRAMDRRAQAIASGIGGLLQRPKTDDITHIATQRRLEPFWHVACHSLYVYERTRPYAVQASALEVQAVTVLGQTFNVVAQGGPARTFTLPVLELCREESTRETFSDGVTGAPVPDGAVMISGPSTEVADPTTLSADGTVAVPPEHHASFVVRKLLSEMLKPVQADSVQEESLVLEKTDLYYRPVYAFEFHWVPKDKRGVLEIDGITGQMRQAQNLTTSLKGMVSRETLFDLGVDTAGLLIPGGNIAIKVARAAIDQQRT